MTDPHSYALDSAGNVLRVVDLLRTRRTVTVTEVSRELDVGKSTAHRLLSTLVAEGFALRDPVHRRYHPGRALVDTGLAALGAAAPLSSAHPLQTLAFESGESVKLLILDGPYTRVVQLADAEPDRRIGGSVGQLLPAHATAGGKVLLSGDSWDDVVTRFGGIFGPVTDQTTTEGAKLRSELAAIAERGWATNSGEASAGVAGIAVPVRGGAGHVIAAISIAAPSDTFTTTRQLDLLPRLFAAAYAIEHPTKAQVSPASPREASAVRR